MKIELEETGQYDQHETHPLPEIANGVLDAAHTECTQNWSAQKQKPYGCGY